MVLVEQVPPPSITQISQTLCRADDVGEQNRGQDPIEEGSGWNPSEELLHLVEELDVLTGERYVVVPGQFDELGTGNPARHMAAVLPVDMAISSSADGECGSLNGWEDL